MKDFKGLSCDSHNNTQPIMKLLNNPLFYNSECPLFTVRYNQTMWNLTGLFQLIMLNMSSYQHNSILNSVSAKC
jgi:hypothetical protein